MNPVFLRISSLALFCLCIDASSSMPTRAQPIAPAPDGTGTVVAPDGERFDITGGSLSRDGKNLFHSFTQFGLSAEQTANFLAQPNIQNILGRINGGDPSYINGLIQVTGGNANLFLMNPAGIVFGANAQLDVPASFTATSASGIAFGDAWFNAIGTPEYSNLVGTPSAFSFSGTTPGAIVNAGELAAGENLSLLGGTVVSTGSLEASNGNLTVASVPGERLVRVSQDGHLLSLDVRPPSTPELPFTPLSLPQLLTGTPASHATNLVVNPDGSVRLGGTNLTVNPGDVAANRVSAQTVTLSAKDNLILSESQLTATGDLNLLAGDTVRVRDSQAEAFSAQAGGNLLVRGNERIDILALNHPQTPFVSGGNLSLVSDGEISGDAHFASGGKFSILDLSGAPGNFVSLYDPIISSTGDITFGDYQGVALKVETTGNIQGGDITITGPDTPASIPNNDPHFTQLTTSRALILQAGKAQLDNPVNAPVTAGGTDFTAGVPTPLLGSVSVGNINTSSQDTADAGPVIIEAAGSITTGNINTSDAALGDGGAVNLTAAQGNVIAGNIDTSDRALGNSGAVTLRVTQSGNITVGNIDAGEQGPGDSGNVTLETARGTIDPGTIDNQQQGPGNQGGVVTNPPVDNNPPPNNGGGGGGGNPPPNNGGGGGGGNPPPNNGGGGGGGNPPPNNGGGGGGGNPPPINGGGGGGSSPPDPNNPPTDRRRPITIDLNNPSNTPIDDSSDNAGNDTADSLDLNRRRVADSSSERQANSEAGNRSRGLTLSALRVAAAQTPRINDAIYLLETAFTQEFENYFGRSLAPSITNLAEIRDRTQEIEQATGLKTGVIYVSFLPTAVPLENAQCQTAQGDRRVGRRRDTLAQAGEPSSLFGCAEQEQLELLMVTAEGEPIRLRVEGANRANVSAVTAEFQRAISDRRLANGTSYLEPAQQLYQWLIAPLEAELEARQIKSLVFSLDSGLRSLPLAALHDGQGFLVERYSTTLVPSLSLTTIRDRDIRPLHVLAMGASEFSDRSPLPGVKVELATITEQLWPGKSFLNETFTPANLKAQRRQRGYGIIHLATHAEFRPGSPKNSYIQFWNQKLRLNELDELGFSKPPVELLVLSACTTALGNREAELGFAGSALQAGVDSTLATLWYVSDRGSLGLTTEFYRQLRQFPVKSEALRRAQLAMIRDTVRIEGDRLYGSGDPIALPSNLSAEGTQSLSHPYYWAAFTLIGSPQ